MTAVEDPTTHLMPTPAATLAPLSDDEILTIYGPTLWRAYVAFATDPYYATEMVEAANRSDKHRAARKVDLRTKQIRTDTDGEGHTSHGLSYCTAR